MSNTDASTRAAARMVRSQSQRVSDSLSALYCLGALLNKPAARLDGVDEEGIRQAIEHLAYYAGRESEEAAAWLAEWQANDSESKPAID